MNYYVHVHCSGDKFVPQSHQQDVIRAIKSISVKPKSGVATKVRNAFLETIKNLGWASECPVSIDSDMTITSIKENVGLCVQTGNMARIYADLIKLQTLYLDDSIKCAIIVLPSQPVAKILGSNIAQSNRLERELEIFKKAYRVPTLVYALE